MSNELIRQNMKNFLFVFSVLLTMTTCTDKQIASKKVEFVNDQEISYFPAIDRYLIKEIGRYYTEGEHCVPFHNIVAVDERNADDILVWGDFWIFNYNQVEDTLKYIAGGSHPGLMHISQTRSGNDVVYQVKAFDQVEDGANLLQSAKKIFGDKFDAFQTINSDEQKREKLRSEVLASYVKKNGLSAAFYQDYGWPAKKIGE